MINDHHRNKFSLIPSLIKEVNVGDWKREQNKQIIK